MRYQPRRVFQDGRTRLENHSDGCATFFNFVASLFVCRTAGDAEEVLIRGVEGVAGMLKQICRDYATLPDPRSLEFHEIRFFYDGLRAELLGRKHG